MARTAEEEQEIDHLEVASAPASCHDLVLEVSTPFHPTEDAGLVGLAIANMFPTIELAIGDGRMTGDGEGPAALARFRRRLREMRIRDTARSVLRDGAEDDKIRIAAATALVNVAEKVKKVHEEKSIRCALCGTTIVLRPEDLPDPPRRASEPGEFLQI